MQSAKSIKGLSPNGQETSIIEDGGGMGPA
jgi:hypothetical protein